MDFSELSLPQQVATHELELRVLQNQVHHQEQLIAALIDLMATPSNSPEFAHALRSLVAERAELGKHP
ncbi:MAG TPA: hypothetical protein VKB52_00975 [Rhodanobacteraceae bacterium]|nr:hypothetical protein [Rhodanobacteraceae bacterium]